MPEPCKIGILNDMSVGPSGHANIERWLQLACDELRDDGTLDRDIEFIHAWGLGLPEGTAAAVEHAFDALAAADVLAVIGPAIGDNALVATPLAERHCIPTINWAGTERARGEYMFHLQVGSHEDESCLLAAHIAAVGEVRWASSMTIVRLVDAISNSSSRRRVRWDWRSPSAPLFSHWRRRRPGRWGGCYRRR